MEFRMNSEQYGEPISKYLHLIYSKSIRESSLPAEWKIAKIIPVHKSGAASSPAHYRPISLTCTCCEMLEHIILKFNTEFVETNQILHPNQ